MSRFQFSLRGLLLALTIFGFWLGWRVDLANKQKEAVKELGSGPNRHVITYTE
jgi:hypothetical protein